MGRDSFTVKASSIAMYQPRDIVLVLDLSASMNDDSEFRSLWTIGMPAIDANLQLIWNELESDLRFDGIHARVHFIVE